MRRIVFALWLGGLLFLLAPGQLPAKTCSNADVSGSYVWTMSGVFTAGLGVPAGPFVRIGRIVTDGSGNIVIAPVTASYNGFLDNTSFVGNYTVNPDCTLNELFVVGPPFNQIVPLAGVVSEGGRKAGKIIVAPFPGFSGKALSEKQDIRGCSTDSFTGHFSLELSGEIASPPGKFLHVASLESSGAGTFTANAVSIYDGTIVPEALSGTYTVDSTCFVSMKFTATSQAGSKTGSMLALMNDRDHARVMLTTPGFVVLGTLTRQ